MIILANGLLWSAAWIALTRTSIAGFAPAPAAAANAWRGGAAMIVLPSAQVSLEPDLRGERNSPWDPQ
jgi:hypothetical protein